MKSCLINFATIVLLFLLQFSVGFITLRQQKILKTMSVDNSNSVEANLNPVTLIVNVEIKPERIEEFLKVYLFAFLQNLIEIQIAYLYDIS
jgi:hypothetical protein